MIDSNKINLILATDCGSTTTKSRLFKKIGDEYRFVVAGEAPTTVEAPYEDVTMGVLNAVREIEELTGLQMLTKKGIKIRSSEDDSGVDLFVTTSSAGGGLQMSVLGITMTISAESADRAALGAGAIVMNVLSQDDNIPAYQKIETIRALRPDMILLAGGTDGGDIIQVTQLAEFLKTAEPKARFGADYSLPIVFAGNIEARDKIKEVLISYTLKIVDNIRPQIDLENPEPSRNAIHDFFMEHVMSHAPGYLKLMKWTEVPIMPTPMGEGLMFQLLAERQKKNIIGVGLGGATTNIYSTYDDKFVRTVSANLGMSYSICNVLREAGIANIRRWIPFDIGEEDLNDILSNKMIRPTTIPSTMRELIIEHAVCREALRLGFIHHKTYARRLRGITMTREVGGAFSWGMGLDTYIEMPNVGIIAGTGGLLSHAPRRVQSMLLLIDGFQTEGVTRLIQDSVFMFPHLGILSTVHQDAAYQIFIKDAIVDMGTCIAVKGDAKKGENMLKVDLNMPGGDLLTEKLALGEIKRIKIPKEEEIDVTITPSKKFDVGAGPGKSMTTNVRGGEVGIIIDARGRPSWQNLEHDEEGKKMLIKWFNSLDMYPDEKLKALL